MVQGMTNEYVSMLQEVWRNFKSFGGVVTLYFIKNSFIVAKLDNSNPKFKEKVTEIINTVDFDEIAFNGDYKPVQALKEVISKLLNNNG